MSELISSVFGIQALWVRVGGVEYPLQAAQDASFTAKQTLVDLFGDNAITPLDIQPKKLDVTVKGKYGRLSLTALNALTGGTFTQFGSGLATNPQEENGGCSMVNAMGTPVVSNAAALLTDGWNFSAISSTQFNITRSSDGTVFGPFTVGYPCTAIPGITISVTGTLVAGSWASFQTTAQTVGALNKNFMTKGDFPTQVALRLITEGPPGESQTEIFIPKAQPAGITVPLKTKDFAYIDFDFTALFDPNSNKIFDVRKYDRPLVTC